MTETNPRTPTGPEHLKEWMKVAQAARWLHEEKPLLHRLLHPKWLGRCMPCFNELSAKYSPLPTTEEQTND